VLKKKKKEEKKKKKFANCPIHIQILYKTKNNKEKEIKI
jgi:hypothetical protein